VSRPSEINNLLIFPNTLFLGLLAKSYSLISHRLISPNTLFFGLLVKSYSLISHRLIFPNTLFLGLLKSIYSRDLLCLDHQKSIICCLPVIGCNFLYIVDVRRMDQVIPAVRALKLLSS
jgi:hypothetical protein